MIKMLKTAAAIAASALLMSCGVGGTVEDRVSAAQARNDGPPIWVVSDFDSTLYLYGTVHLLPDDLDWQKQDMRDAFDEAGTVFFEMDTGNDALIQASVLTQDLGQYTSGQRLSDKLDAYQLKLLEAAANNGDLTLPALDSMKPWLASEFLTVAAATNAGLSPDLAADTALKSRAARLRKNVIYLDTVEGQIRASADQPDFVQMMILTDTLERFNSIGDDMVRIADYWAVGQVAPLEQKTVKVIAQSSPEMYLRLIKERNISWSKQFTRFLEDSGTGFAAVGAAHLLGDDSVQAMLREQGYDVSRYYAFQGENVIKPVTLDQAN